MFRSIQSLKLKAARCGMISSVGFAVEMSRSGKGVELGGDLNEIMIAYKAASLWRLSLTIRGIVPLKLRVISRNKESLLIQISVKRTWLKAVFSSSTRLH